MGLDIYLYRVRKDKGNKDDISEIYYFLNPTDPDDIKLISNYKNIIGLDVLHEDSETYYDFKKIGISDDTHEFAMTDGTVYKVHDKTHELYTIFVNVYIENSKLSDNDILLLNKYNFDKFQAEQKLNICANTVLSSEDKYHIYMFISNIISVTINLDTCPTYIQNGYTVYCTEEGYQRKGLKPGYADDENIEEFIFTKDKLMYIYDTYVKDEYKEHFKTQILDQFIEGTHIVHFSY